MKRVKGVWDGSVVRLEEKVDLPPNIEVEVLVPDPEDESLAELLDRLPEVPPGEAPSEEEIVALVHEVRKRQR